MCLLLRYTLDLALDEAEGALYVAMELMDSDMHQIIQSKQQLSESHHKCLMTQLLHGVRALHEAGVLHRDLKVKQAEAKLTSSPP